MNKLFFGKRFVFPNEAQKINLKLSENHHIYLKVNSTIEIYNI